MTHRAFPARVGRTRARAKSLSAGPSAVQAQPPAGGHRPAADGVRSRSREPVAPTRARRGYTGSVSAAVERGERRERSKLKRAIALRIQGKSYDEIATKLGIAKSTVHKQLSGVFELLDPERQQQYEQHRVSLLSAVEMRMVGALADDTRLEKASLNNVAYALTQVHQARRLESGESTANLALHQLVETVERQRAKTRRTAIEPTAPSVSA